MHSGVAIDLLALGAGAWRQADKETFREEERREERPVPGCDESQQLHGGVGRERELRPPERRTRFRGWDEGIGLGIIS